jgi:hypothetical protein
VESASDEWPATRLTQRSHEAMTQTKIVREFSLYDSLCAQRRSLYGQIEDDGRIVRQLADAALASSNVEDVARQQLNRQQLEICAKAVDRAREKLVQRIVEAMAKQARVSAPTLRIPPARNSDELRTQIDDALTKTAEAIAKEAAHKDAVRRFDSAKADFDRWRGELIREGVPEIVASERAKAKLGDRANDLWLPGSFADLTGRELAGGTIMAGGL